MSLHFSFVRASRVSINFSLYLIDTVVCVYVRIARGLFEEAILAKRFLLNTIFNLFNKFDRQTKEAETKREKERSSKEREMKGRRKGQDRVDGPCSIIDGTRLNGL